MNSVTASACCHRHARPADRRPGAVLDLAALRVPAALMLSIATVVPLIPAHPALACPLRTFTGIPCPLCGMTTSVGATVRFDLAEAWAASPAGPAVVALAVAALLIRRPVRIGIPLPAVVGVLGVMWLFQLVRFGFL